MNNPERARLLPIVFLLVALSLVTPWANAGEIEPLRQPQIESSLMLDMGEILR